ncbi:nuclear transport factor 2 family protein [Streptomyces sp. NPDC088789]|uniref:nuclear transport factor 2 family protein n=1 Tax=Streptomyces sp. NPDC088789 TaxID=3365899 RepID=UPI00382E13F4
MDKEPQTVAVLGLGRMGSALAARLAGVAGPEVIGWTRSGRAGTGRARTRRTRTGLARTGGAFAVADDPGTAVADADVVVLALFDGPACHQVLDRVRGALRAETVVLNTGTVGPDEAAALARAVGPSYVHAPVLGSVGAASAGELEILVAGGEEAVRRGRGVLERLGRMRRVGTGAGDAATAAALKLVANCGLAGGVLALREALRQGEALGLPRERVLEVLEPGVLGGLVGRKRGFLDGASAAAPAEFTVGALAKDMALLAAASGSPSPLAADLAGTPVDADADIAAAATVPAVGDDVLEPLRAYLRGHATGDPVHFRAAFLPGAHVEGIREGEFVSWGLAEYCGRFPGQPAADEATRFRRIDAVDVRGTVATATMTLRHGADTFIDAFLLVRTAGGWRIANKAYHREATAAGTAAVAVAATATAAGG